MFGHVPSFHFAASVHPSLPAVIRGRPYDCPPRGEIATPECRAYSRTRRERAVTRSVRVSNSELAAEVVGRAKELAEISRFIDDASHGPTVLLFEGAAGIGKTTLWQSGVALARERLFWVLSCRPAEAETKLAYAALGDLLEPVLDHVLPGLPEPQQRALEVALLRADGGRGRVAPRAVSVGVLSVLRALSSIGPVLVAVDDVQWLDAASSRVLAFAVR